MTHRGKHVRAGWIGLSLTAPTALLLSSSCDSPSDIEVVGNVVPLTLEVTPLSGGPGDTIRLVGIAHNLTGLAIELGIACRPGISFYITRPTGRQASVYDGVAFTCEGKDSNSLQPGETDSVSWSWVVPDTTGTYHARAALDFRDGQVNLSAPAAIDVE